MIEIKFYDSLNPQIIDIRTAVFVKEQGFKEEFDDIDEKSVHILLFYDGVPCATGRLFPAGKLSCEGKESDGVYKIGRIAVLKDYRGKNLGATVISQLENKCRETGGKTILLSAQCRAKHFYEKQGYTSCGEEFLEEYCPHINMKKDL